MNARELFLPCLAMLASCSACGSDDVLPERPFRDDWVVEAVIDFVHTDDDGSALISTLSIGGPGGDNFANRGDVIVRYDGPPDTMTVELRRFTMASNEDSAEEQLELLGPWAYEGTVEHPRLKDPDDECLDGWREGCQLRVFADAGLQREVSGADIRVTLPSDYRGVIDIETEDASSVSDYLSRADVCIDGLPGSADISMHSGRAWVRVADDVSPMPTCPAADVEACEGWTIPGPDGEPVSSPWAPDCPCSTAGHPFGRVAVDSRDVDRTDARVDLPSGLWTALYLENRLVDALDRDCEATVTLPTDALALDPADSAAELRGSYAYPGAPALGGAGYRVSLESGSCGPVSFSEGPDDYGGPGGGLDQPSERRGNLEVCSGCLPTSCDVLVP